MKIRINDINVGERLREDLGDLSNLAKSLKQHGLIHALVVDEDLNLIAGQRRLEAAKLIGWMEIDVAYKTELTEKQKRALELEENLYRKDLSLSEIEKSRTLVELAKIKTEEKLAENKKYQEEFRPTLGRNVGRPKEVGSVREAAKEVGVPIQTLHDAQRHVQAVDKYPELEPLPKMQAIKIAKELDDSLKEGKEEAKELFQEEDGPENTGDISFMLEPGYLPPAERVKRNTFIRLSKLFYRFSVIVTGVTQWKGMEEAAREEDFNSLVQAYSRLCGIQKTIDSWVKIIHQEITQQKNLRRVK